MTELRENQKLSRAIRVYGIEQPVIVELTKDGLRFRVPGSFASVGAAWPQIVKGCLTPDKVKSYLHGKPYEFLQQAAREVTERKAKRIERSERRRQHSARTVTGTPGSSAGSESVPSWRYS